jgi:hypothetical protein
MVSAMKRTAATGTLLALALATAQAAPATAAVSDGRLATASSPTSGGERAVVARADVVTAALHLEADATPAPATLTAAAEAPVPSLAGSVADDTGSAADRDAEAPRARGPPLP